MSILRLQRYSPDLNLPHKDESGRPTPFETVKEIGEETLALDRGNTYRCPYLLTGALDRPRGSAAHGKNQGHDNNRTDDEGRPLGILAETRSRG